MAARSERSGRIWVRAENPSGACGYIGHMTIDELKSRAVGDEFDATCPACGLFHLTREEIVRLESKKITKSRKFADLQKEAEEDAL
ncbi:MAG: hypothetical protein ACK5PS_02345 [Desulfopila sp.]